MTSARSELQKFRSERRDERSYDHSSQLHVLSTISPQHLHTKYHQTLVIEFNFIGNHTKGPVYFKITGDTRKEKE